MSCDMICRVDTVTTTGVPRGQVNDRVRPGAGGRAWQGRLEWGLYGRQGLRGAWDFLRAFAVVCQATQEVEALAKIRPVLSARGDGGGVCGGLGRRQLYRAFCSAIAVSSVGFFAPVLLLGRTVRLMRVVVLSVILEGPVVARWFHLPPCGFQTCQSRRSCLLWPVDSICVISHRR